MPYACVLHVCRMCACGPLHPHYFAYTFAHAHASTHACLYARIRARSEDHAAWCMPHSEGSLPVFFFTAPKATTCSAAPHRTTLHCTVRWHKKCRALSVVSRLRQIVRHRRRVRCYALWHACMIVYVQCCAGSCRDMLRCGRCAACMCTQARMWQASMSRPHRRSSRSLR